MGIDTSLNCEAIPFVPRDLSAVTRNYTPPVTSKQKLRFIGTSQTSIAQCNFGTKFGDDGCTDGAELLQLSPTTNDHIGLTLPMPR